MRYRAKIIPKAAPNDEGRWITIELDHDLGHTAPWSEVERVLGPHIPSDHFLVMYDPLWSRT